MKKKFKGVLEPSHDGLGWVVVRIPFDATKAWKEKIRMRVRGTVNGAAFRTSLFPYKSGGQMLLVNKKLQKEAKATVGTMVTVEIEPDIEERPQAKLAPELAKLFKSNPSVQKFYDSLSDSMKRDIERHMTELKSPEKRQKRAEAFAERVLLTLEGEKELPPILVTVFKRYPRAMEGWQKMTPVQRRGHLMGVFYYPKVRSRVRSVL